MRNFLKLFSPVTFSIIFVDKLSFLENYVFLVFYLCIIYIFTKHPYVPEPENLKTGGKIEEAFP